jgi:hypothetical protein
MVMTSCKPSNFAPGTINLRLGAVRRLAYEAADCGLPSADLTAGIRRVKGVKKLGVRLGKWLTAEQGQALWQVAFFYAAHFFDRPGDEARARDYSNRNIVRSVMG